MTLGDFILSWRTENSMSQATFAKRASLSKGYISMLENNLNPTTGKSIAPTIDVFEKVAKAVGVSLAELMEQMDASQKISMEHSLNRVSAGNTKLSEADYSFIELYHRASDEDKEVIRLILRKYENPASHAPASAG